jgi:hypothetical protein
LATHEVERVVLGNWPIQGAGDGSAEGRASHSAEESSGHPAQHQSDATCRDPETYAGGSREHGPTDAEGLTPRFLTDHSGSTGFVCGGNAIARDREGNDDRPASDPSNRGGVPRHPRRASSDELTSGGTG